MKYVGSKARIAKHIVPIIQQQIDSKDCSLYIEPFVGGANVLTYIQCATKLGIDISLPLITLLRHVTERGGLPEYITKEQYDDIRQHPERYPPYYVGVAGYLASYNGKYFGGYAGTVTTKAGTVRNYYDEAKRNLEKQAKLLQASRPIFQCGDYKDLDSLYHRPIENAVIYADPPYDGTTGYTGKFNSAEFWNECRRWAANGNTVIVSEITAPNDFMCIWEKPVVRTLNHSDRTTVTEKLFIKG